MKHRCELGQSLVEVIVSVGIAVILAIALISAGLISNKTARSARTNTQATKLAEQAIEQIRVFRDRQGFSALSTAGNGNCFVLNTASSDPAAWGLVTLGCPEVINLDNVSFSRNFIIADTSPADVNKKLITAVVSWLDSGGTQTVTSQTILSLWSAP